MSSSLKITRRSTVTESAPRFTTRSYGGDSKYKFRPTVQPRKNTIVTRTVGGPVQSSVSQIVRSTSYGYGAGIGPSAGAYNSITSKQVGDVKDSREKEKKDMQDLNERFAGYIEKVRFLEAQNKKLSDELGKLKDKWGKETASIKAMYQSELEEVRKLHDDAEKDKTKEELKNSALQDTIDELNAKVQELEDENENLRDLLKSRDQEICEANSELEILRKNCDYLEEQLRKSKDEVAKYVQLYNNARTDLDQATLNHIDAENRRQTLEEELEFMKQIHEQELKELSALAYRDSTMENRQFWQNELGECMREIQSMYEDKLGSMRAELENYYTVRIQEFRTGSTKHGMETQHAKEESKRLRTQLGDLRGRVGDLEARNVLLEKELQEKLRELEEKEASWESEKLELMGENQKLRDQLEILCKQLEDITDAKLGLELEISAYRKLLEGEENRSSGFRGVIESIISGRDDDDDSSMRMSQVVKGEMSAKTTYQRSAKGPVGISECSPDGKFVVIENTGKKEESLKGHSIKRVIDGNKTYNYTITDNIILNTGDKKKLKVYSSKVSPSEFDSKCLSLSADVETWGIGANIKTSLFGENGDEKATHSQRTIYVS